MFAKYPNRHDVVQFYFWFGTKKKMVMLGIYIGIKFVKNKSPYRSDK